MILFILGILLVLGLFIGFGFYENDNCDIKWGIRKLQLVSLFGIVIGILGCIKTVPTGSTGIVTTFGKVEDYTLDSGISFMEPWKKVICMDNRTQKQSLDLSCFSSDIQEVTVTYTINYQINKANAQEIYKTIGVDYFTTIVQPKALEAVKGAFAKYTAEALIESRAGLSKEIEQILREDLANYNIDIVSTSIENIDFTDAFTDAVESKQVAEQNKLKAQTEQAQLTLEAEASAERQIIQAEADAQAAVIKANNDAEVAKIGSDAAEYQGIKDAAIMSNLGEMLQRYPQLIDYYYTTNWDGKLPDTMLGDSANVLFNK